MKELSPPSPRRQLHTRQIVCTGWEREDGLWEVEGRLSDVRTHPVDDSRGNFAREAGDPIHLMSLRITLDDRFVIVAAEAVSHQTPYADCPSINPAYGALVGMRIEAGFNHAVKTRFRGVGGCTHLTELIGPIATTAFQSIGPAMDRRNGKTMIGPLEASRQQRLLDSCFALRRGGPAVRSRWGLAGAEPDLHAAPLTPAGSPST